MAQTATIDTAAAHLAGAMGKPVWTLLKSTPDWRWATRDDGMTSLWYPSMRLFQQNQPGDWTPIFASLRNELTARISG